MINKYKKMLVVDGIPYNHDKKNDDIYTEDFIYVGKWDQGKQNINWIDDEYEELHNEKKSNLKYKFYDNKTTLIDDIKDDRLYNHDDRDFIYNSSDEGSSGSDDERSDGEGDNGVSDRESSDEGSDNELSDRASSDEDSDNELSDGESSNIDESSGSDVSDDGISDNEQSDGESSNDDIDEGINSDSASDEEGHEGDGVNDGSSSDKEGEHVISDNEMSDNEMSDNEISDNEGSDSEGDVSDEDNYFGSDNINDMDSIDLDDLDNIENEQKGGIGKDEDFLLFSKSKGGSKFKFGDYLKLWGINY